MSDWDKKSIDRLNYSLMNINDRLWDISQEMRDQTEGQKQIIRAIESIAEIMLEQDIVCQEREKKGESK